MENIKISSNIAQCEACAHWFCFDFRGGINRIENYKTCDFCGKIEKLKYQDNPNHLYELTGAIVENRWRYFYIKDMFGIKKIDLLLCSEGCMEKLLQKLGEYFEIGLDLYGTYWRDEEREFFKKYTKNQTN